VKQNNEPISIAFKGVGDRDGVRYDKADIIKICHVGEDFALSFYQVDYQSVANFATGVSTLEVGEMSPMPVAKVTMSEATYREMAKQVNDILAKYEAKKADSHEVK
jgi:hypothetical protein